MVDDRPARASGKPRLRLGHITYSNCFPVHSRLVDQPRSGDPTLVEGVPSALNAMLAEGAIDVAPSSSIEFAHHADRYRILPELVIGSAGPVRSIQFVADWPPEELAGRTVAIPTASATSVVLLKILLQVRWRVDANFQWFDQATDDPFADGAAAALFIGDTALRPNLHADRPVHLDLGLEWWRETDLPFAFAVWQAAPGSRSSLRNLHAVLLESREYGMGERRRLAERYAPHFRMTPDGLDRYWADLRYDLAPDMIRGLETFYRFAAEIGEIARAPELRWVD